MTKDEEHAWLREWEREVKDWGWKINNRSFRPDETVLDDAGWWQYTLMKGKYVWTVIVATRNMAEFGPDEAYMFERIGLEDLPLSQPEQEGLMKQVLIAGMRELEAQK